MRGPLWVVISLLSLIVLTVWTSCSSGPPAAKMGTPEWYWNAANEVFTTGDLAKTQEHLEKVVLSDNPFRARATIWRLVMSGGMALGYKDLAEAYDDGGAASKAAAGDFRRRAADALRSSKQYCIAEAQELERFLKESGTNEYSLDFVFPAASPAEDPAIGRIRKGMMPSEEERAKAEHLTVKRGVLFETARIVGAGDDTSKTAALFEKKPVKVARPVFLYGIAESLLEQSRIFDRKKLNEPDKKKILLQMASECLKPASEAGDADLKKKSKSLQEKIAKEQKSLPKSV